MRQASKAFRQTIAAALVGDYRREHLFTRSDSEFQELIVACVREIEEHVAALFKIDPRATALAKPKDRHKPRRNQMKFDIRSENVPNPRHRSNGPCRHQALTLHVLFAEIGRDLNAKAWELRSTTSLARLLASELRRDEARATLAEIYDWFTEASMPPT